MAKQPTERCNSVAGSLSPAGVVAPVNRLPTELLRVVFSLALTNASQCTLAAVCSRWRDVVMADCLLWSVLRVGKRTLPGLSVWLKRSKGALLDLTLSGVLELDEEALQRAKRLECVVRPSQVQAGEISGLISATGAELKEFVLTQAITGTSERIQLLAAPAPPRSGTR